ncbi:MAG: ferredoxin-type protein NapG [Alphaproteobacteria bacterium]|jgi:ferredoxin-type protein NapG|nr:ferredoxin-type protein NapG [Alphaproteobacteria bacterium]MDP6567791.1 ferredoxin-type protein NapG [Alphaproteobacteria bacterium]MDP6813866.1 ferredoxin-type protein NapG [Alphaproteobacteria bacterium]
MAPSWVHNDRSDIDRRRFLGDAARGACGAGILGLALGVTVRQTAATPAAALRPPGALPEDDFQSACVRCGLCVRDCPYDTLRLAGFGRGMATGTPYFVAREVPCEMCEDIPCVEACPTGALDKDLDDIDQARMGIAVLVGQETCLNYLGLRCDVCYRVCPLMGEAITLERRHNERTGKHAEFIPIVHSDQCTGCGKCERACVLPKAAIKVLPERLATGRLGAHYRLGWEEKRRRGEALIQGLIDLPDRGPAPAGPKLPRKLPGGGYKGFQP